MDRLFLDANVLFSAAYSRSSRVRRLWRLRGITLVTSEHAAEEARRNLATDAQRAELQRLLRKTTITAAMAENAEGTLSVRLPEKDRPILRAAIAARCSHLITGDFQHFGAYFDRVVDGVRIQPPATYLASR